MTAFTLPGAEPTLLPGSGEIGCLLVHGFTAMPDEMLPLALHLHAQGHTALCLRLPGHATRPDDLRRVTYRDWLTAVEDGIAILRGAVRAVFLIGQSLGGMLALIAASRFSLHGVAALSVPFDPRFHQSRLLLHMIARLQPTIRKVAADRADPLGDRRETDYPAYPAYPTFTVLQMHPLRRELADALSHVRTPALLLQGTADATIPPESLLNLYSALQQTTRQMVWVKDAGHGITLDPHRQSAFDAITAFIRRITQPEEFP